MTVPWRGVLADIERVTTVAGRAAVGGYSIEGARLHARALAAGITPYAALVSDRSDRNRRDRDGDLPERLAAAGCSLHVVPDGVIDALTQGRASDGIVGLVRLPHEPQLADLLQADGTRRPLLLVAVEVEDPGNVGALVRTALASGATAFIGVGLSDPFHPKAVRTSMGSLFRLPLLRFAAPQLMLDALGSLGVTTVGAVSSGGIPLPALRLDAPALAVCMGGEAHGLPAAVAEALDLRVTIPMGAAIDSYSVNAAAAVILYELSRGR